ncbi:hypothetical protein BHM03_00015778 [Ensete ventricosum]|nr:hypothetical protein BHM03_00015778 [Ensete ventricosum]
MSINLKEGDRYVVNHGEDMTIVDFGGYVSLAEKEDAGMAGRGNLTWDKRSRIDEAEVVAGQRKQGDLDGRKRRFNDYSKRSRGCSISHTGAFVATEAVATEAEVSTGVRQLRVAATTVVATVIGLRPRLGYKWKDLGEKDLPGLEGAIRARPQSRRRDDAGSAKQRKGRCYRRTTKERSRHCSTKEEVPSTSFRPRRQRKDAGALDRGGCNGSRGDSDGHRRSNGASDFIEVFGKGVDDGGSAEVPKKRCHRMRITWSNYSSIAEEGDDGEDGLPGRRTSEDYHR